MKKYLSIGEVVKMKGVSHRALRHYDELGILTPAYTNPENKYRYYSKNQMIVLDIVMLCAPLGIPLQHFKNYILGDGSIDSKQMIKDAKSKALEKQKEIEQKLYFLDTALEHFADIHENAKKSKEYIKHLDKRYFLVVSAPQNFGSLHDYWAKITLLYKNSIQNDFSMSIVQGLCFRLENSATQAKYFVEVKEPRMEHPDILTIPKADFLCELFEEECFFEAIEKYSKHERYLAGNILILSDIFEESISHKPVPFEMQLML